MNLSAHACRGCSGPWAESADVDVVDLKFINDLECVKEMFFGFSGVADNNIGADGDFRDRSFECAYDVGECFNGVSASHCFQNLIISCLERNV